MFPGVGSRSEAEGNKVKMTSHGKDLSGESSSQRLGKKSNDVDLGSVVFGTSKHLGV